MSQDPAVEGSASPGPAKGAQDAANASQERQQAPRDEVGREAQNGNGQGRDGDTNNEGGGLQTETVKETPEELRSQLDALRRELANNLQKKQSIDRTLVRSSFELASNSLDIDYKHPIFNVCIGQS